MLNYVPKLKQTTGNSQAVAMSQNAVTVELAGKSPTTHNHTLASLSEKSYNSLTDKPNLSLLEDILDIDFFIPTPNDMIIDDAFDYGLIAYREEDKTLHTFNPTINDWVEIPFAWKLYVNNDSTSAGYCKIYVHTDSGLVLVPDALIIGIIAGTAFDGLRGKALEDAWSAFAATWAAMTTTSKTVSGAINELNAGKLNTSDALNQSPRSIDLAAGANIDCSLGEEFIKTCGASQAFTISNPILRKGFRLKLTGGMLNVPTFTGYTVNWILSSLVTDYVPANTNYLWCEIRSAGQIFCFWGA